jgi:hypothetical protein
MSVFLEDFHSSLVIPYIADRLLLLDLVLDNLLLCSHGLRISPLLTRRVIFHSILVFCLDFWVGSFFVVV